MAMKWLLLMAATMLISAGCAVHYYDAKTGTEHLWGFGHLKMKALPEGNGPLTSSNAVMAYVTSVGTCGLSFGWGQEFSGLTAGWDSRSRLIIRQDGACFGFIWPTNSIWMPWDTRGLFSLRLTTNFPPELKQNEPPNNP